MFRRPPIAAHLVVVACNLALILSYRWTWTLWQVRPDGIPNLPALGSLHSLRMAPVLLGACALALAAPRVGTAAHAVALLIAVLGDQVRLQPEFISLTLLALAAAWGSRRLCRAHLGTLWFWAGCNKALSYGWAGGGAAFIADSVHLGSYRWLVAWAVPAVEMALGISTIFPRLRLVSGVGGTLLHLGIFAALSPVMASFNSAVWPWNLAFAVATPIVFLTGWRPLRLDPLDGGHRNLASLGVATMAVLPVGFYVGFSDAYLSHNLYSSNTAAAGICRGTQCRPFAPDGFTDLNVPVPPEVRLFRAWFRSTCVPGEVFVMTRPANRVVGSRQVRSACPPRAPDPGIDRAD